MSKFEDYITYEEDSDEAKPKEKPRYKRSIRHRHRPSDAALMVLEVKDAVRDKIDDEDTLKRLTDVLFDQPEASLEFAVASAGVFEVLSLAKVDVAELNPTTAQAMEVLFMGYMLEYFERSEKQFGHLDAVKSERVKNILERLFGENEKEQTDEKE